MNPFIIQIIEAILAVLKDCPAPEKKRLAFLRKPEPVHKLRVWLKVRKKMSQNDFNLGMQELQAMAKSATDADLKDILSQSA